MNPDPSLLSQRLKDLLRRLLLLSRGAKRALVLSADVVLCITSVWIAFSLRLGEWVFFTSEVVKVQVACLALFPPIFFATGIYRHIFRFAGSGTIFQLARAVAVLAVPLVTLFVFVSVPNVPRTIAFLVPILFFLLLAISRIVARHLFVDLLGSKNLTGGAKRTLIYGAGSAGQQLASSLRRDPKFVVAGFIDDDERLDGQRLDAIPVHHSERLATLIAHGNVEVLVLALPNVSRAKRRDIINRLVEFRVQVLTLPSMSDLVDGSISINDVREIKIDDLLGRDPVPPNEVLLGRTVCGKCVLITGAGGSIGSELSRQVARLHPAKLVLADISEPALYEIDRELRELQAREGVNAETVAELINLVDLKATSRLFERWRPDTVFHTAAYKHVPLIESNVISGLRNNIIGTRNAALAAREKGVSHFILVSTDKAVRPTNVMGASKRICELILQCSAQAQGRTRFAMVRFGNVLGSSGSVVPQFEKQIREGGPVTLTHRDITRFFMTIPEAAQLVIQAGALAEGGEVFLLDMGKPVRIFDLARSMIELAGLDVRDSDNPHGDIEIVEIGLRPGEKLYEELLIDERAEATHHPRIMKANENSLPASRLESELAALEAAIEDGDASAALAIVRRLVPEYRSLDLAGLVLPASA